MTTHALNNITINYTMSNSTIKYTVSNAFECYGIPATEKRNTLEAAEQAANNLAEAIAECFYQHDGDQAIIPFYSSEGKTGLSSEIKFQSDLSLDSGAHADEDEEDGVAGRLPWSELVKRIRREAVVISKITWSPVNWQQEPDAEQKADENTEYTLRDCLERHPDELINDGGTTWRTDNLLAELELEDDPLLDQEVHVDEIGIYFFDDRGYMISPAAYRFEQEQSQIEQQQQPEQWQQEPGTTEKVRSEAIVDAILEGRAYCRGKAKVVVYCTVRHPDDPDTVEFSWVDILPRLKSWDSPIC